MGAKSKKGKQSQLDKKPTKIPSFCPDLPTHVQSLLAKNATLRQNISQNISCGGNVTKSYRLLPRQCNPIGKSPFPQLSVNDNGHTDRCRNESPGFLYTLSITCCLGDEKVIRELPPSWVGRFGPGVYNYIHQYIQDSNYRPSGMLPLLVMSVPFKHFTLSSPRADRNSTCTMMVLTGFQKPAVVFCDPSGGNYAWLKHDSTLVDPHSSNQQLMKFTNAIGFKGKFYALSLQGTLAVIEKIDSHFRITSLGTNRAVPSVHSMHFKEYLIESNGEILLVFLVSRKSIHRVENVEVYRLRFDKLSWVKMESIGDRTLFVGTNWCISVDASEIGCRLDCIYFSYETDDEWWVYDMERGSISPGWKNCDSTTN
ncbi:uncharacterized protein LOC131326560 [Rhododendron vialii]|uniref:uncharacterized protein LOC131326560 n=1 Tax=Rhododendron vialii TaxID=182163 RepID=UPI0026604A8A|nr:uncharacterized protein LOC131326560 [Rhododendron vialii]